MLTRWTAFTLWALVAASAVYWGLRLFVQPAATPSGTVVATAEGPLRGELSRLLGADEAAPVQAPEPVADPRFQLLGVLSAAGRHAQSEGVALIAVDERPPRAYRVGMVVDGDTVLQAVHPRGAELGPRGGLALVALELPPPAPAATGALPGVGGNGPLGTGGAQGTQIFVPAGQTAPNFTRNRSPAAIAPPPGSFPLPVPPPPMPMQLDSVSADTDTHDGQVPTGSDTATDQTDQVSGQGASPLR